MDFNVGQGTLGASGSLENTDPTCIGKVATFESEDFILTTLKSMPRYKFTFTTTILVSQAG